MSHRILVVDDEPNYRRVLALMLASLDSASPVEVREAGDGQAALDVLDKEAIDLVITDVSMPRMNGLELLERLRADKNAPPVVVITAHSSIDDAVDAIRRGAIDYLQKPFDEARLLLTVRRALVMTDLLQENTRLRDDVRAQHDFAAIKGDSPALLAALRIAAKVAAAEAAVLITGESGTGKELFARAIHHNSKRSAGPFVALNCAAIPEGLLEAELFGAEAGAFTGANKRRRGRVELARGGTLFLDEIGDMPTPVQAKLLRLLQEKTFTPLGSEQELRADVRFVCATHRDLARAVAEGRFREDLRFRVSVLAVNLPPLRERDDDVQLLADAVVARVCAQMGKRLLPLLPAARRALAAHTWPGNVRELGNVLERAVILSEGTAIDANDLDLPTVIAPVAAPGGAAAQTMFTLPQEGISLDAVERSLLEQALMRAKGNKSQAARLLGLTRATLRYRIEKAALRDTDEDET